MAGFVNGILVKFQLKNWKISLWIPSGFSGLNSSRIPDRKNTEKYEKISGNPKKKLCFLFWNIFKILLLFIAKYVVCIFFQIIVKLQILITQPFKYVANLFVVCWAILVSTQHSDPDSKKMFKKSDFVSKYIMCFNLSITGEKKLYFHQIS